MAREVARRLADSPLPGVEVVERHDPTALIELWAGCTLSVVCDAVRSGSPAGTLHVVRTGPDQPPLTEGHAQEAGSHDFGLASAVELARALDRLPEVVVVGVEAQSFGWGEALTGPVADAVPAAAAEVLRVLQR
ncbi:hydrogenase maturation protease [Actinotalea sp. M2MS4P-6]|nr:hydrogenase maturation protease [Actinotalea sp. M2MS4P-6]